MKEKEVEVLEEKILTAKQEEKVNDLNSQIEVKDFEIKKFGHLVVNKSRNVTYVKISHLRSTITMSHLYKIRHPLGGPRNFRKFISQERPIRILI